MFVCMCVTVLAFSILKHQNLKQEKCSRHAYNVIVTLQPQQEDTAAQCAGVSVIFRVVAECTWQMSNTNHNYKESYTPATHFFLKGIIS